MKKSKWLVLKTGVPAREKLLDVILELRNIKNKDYFINPKIENLFSPFMLKDVEKAVLRIKRAIDKKEKIGIYIDYDVDGLTGGALLYRNFLNFGINPEVKIPHRIKEGYGIKKEGLKELRDKGVTLVVTVDSGIKAIEEIEWANNNGLEVIVTDHHIPGDILPPAYAVINPHLNRYPFPFLSGVGVVFKLLYALYDILNIDKTPLLWDLDLVTLGTIGDIVPLIYENRIMVSLGLKVLEKSKKLGLKVLKKFAGVDEFVNTWHVSFILAPRLNAPGRMDFADIAFRLLTSKKIDEVVKYAEVLEDINRKRQKEQEKIVEEAMEIIQKEGKENDYVILCKGKNWHPGVIGIVASKILKVYKRPVIVFSDEGDILRGSGRSVKNVDIMLLLDNLRDLIVEYGGHKKAAGLKIESRKYKEFEEKMEMISHMVIKEEDLEDYIEIECEFPIYEWDLELYADVIKKLEPFGEENPRPLFIDKNVRIMGNLKIRKNGHLEFYVGKNNRFFRAFVPDKGDIAEKLDTGMSIDVVYSPDIDYYSKKREIYMKIYDLDIAKD